MSAEVLELGQAEALVVTAVEAADRSAAAGTATADQSLLVETVESWVAAASGCNQGSP